MDFSSHSASLFLDVEERSASPKAASRCRRGSASSRVTRKITLYSNGSNLDGVGGNDGVGYNRISDNHYGANVPLQQKFGGRGIFFLN